MRYHLSPVAQDDETRTNPDVEWKVMRMIERQGKRDTHNEAYMQEQEQVIKSLEQEVKDVKQESEDVKRELKDFKQEVKDVKQEPKDAKQQLRDAREQWKIAKNSLYRFTIPLQPRPNAAGTS